MKLWIKIGLPIGLLTLVAMSGLLVMEQPWAAIGMALFGIAIIVFTRQSLAPLEDVTAVVEGIADGDLEQDSVDYNRNDEIGRLARSTNHMIGQLNGLADTAEKLARGEIDVVDAEQKVLETGQLADADLEPSADDGELERSFIRMNNQMRRLTIQARIIADDDLYNPLLDERVPGELGESFALMVRNLRTIADRAKDIAEGDLTSDVDGDGDLTSAFNQMVTGLNDLVQRIVETAIHISSASEQILVVLQEQELAASHQASGVEETQRTMETLLASAKKIADNSQTVYKSAEKTQANNRTVAERIGELKSHTARITEILEVIKSIADRSDLLALNASLEGMRAGEAGKGFTLVAAEMRRLAENIKESIGDIKELVSDIRESSMATVMATEEGSRLSEQTTETALQISLITQQQKSGTEQVTQSMEELSHLINQGVSGTREVTTAAKDLADAADVLRTLVDEFEVDNQPDDSRGSNRSSHRGQQNHESRRLDDRGPSASDRLAKSGGTSSSDDVDATRTRESFAVDPRATLSRSKEFARKARETEATPAHLSRDDVEAPSRERGDDENDDGGLDTPTVEFSSATDDGGLFDELGSIAGSDRPENAGSSGEFESIARDIEEHDIDSRDASEIDDDDEEASETK